MLLPIENAIRNDQKWWKKLNLATTQVFGVILRDKNVHIIIAEDILQREQPERWNQNVNHGLLMMASWSTYLSKRFSAALRAATAHLLCTDCRRNEYCAVILIAIEFVSM